MGAEISREEFHGGRDSRSSATSSRSESRSGKETRKAFKKKPKTKNPIVTTKEPPGHGFKKRMPDDRHWVFGGAQIAKNDGLSDLYWDLMNGDLNAPVHDVLYSGNAKVLDVGCKEGIWIIQMARRFPSASFLGIDLHPPTSISQFDQSLRLEALPSNVSFESVDVTAQLPFQDNTFDYVIARQMVTSIKGGVSGWKVFLNELIRVTKDGGYVELMDTNWIPTDAGPSLKRFYIESGEMSKESGVDLQQGANIGRLLESSFLLADVRHDYVSCPIGWSGPLGDKLANVMTDFLTMVEEPMRERLCLTKQPYGDEYELFKKAALEECVLRETFLDFYYAYGRKCISN